MFNKKLDVITLVVIKYCNCLSSFYSNIITVCCKVLYLYGQANLWHHVILLYYYGVDEYPASAPFTYVTYTLLDIHCINKAHIISTISLSIFSQLIH